MQLVKKFFILAFILFLFVGFAYTAIRIKNSLTANNYSNYWQTQSIDNASYTFAILGDSTALGVGASKPENSFIGIIRDRITMEKTIPIKIVNLAENNATFEDIDEKQLPKLKDERPNIVLIVAGRSNVDKKRLDEDALLDMLSKLPSAVSYITEIPISYDSDKNKIAQVYNQIISEEAEKTGVEVIPLYKETLKYQYDLSYYDWDFIHPNDHGQRIWAEIIAAKIL